MDAARTKLSPSSTEQELWAVLEGLTLALDDAHVVLTAQIDGSRRRLAGGRGATLTTLRQAHAAAGASAGSLGAYGQRWVASTREAMQKHLSGGNASALQTQAQWGLYTPPGASAPLGYLALRGLSNYTSADQPSKDIEAINTLLTEVFAACIDCSALVLDLSQNRGGDDSVAMAVAARFATSDSTLPVLRKQAIAKAAGAADWQTLAIVPNALPRFTKPLHVLIDSVTVSAAEVLAASLAQLPQVELHGQPTRGALSDALEKTLPNGWQVTLSPEVYQTGDGKDLEISGVQPKHLRVLFAPERMPTTHAPSVLALMTAISRP